MTEREIAGGAPVIGLVDLGSNSVRLMAVRINPNRSYTVLTRHKRMVRLGEDAFAKGRLSGEAMRRTISALLDIAEMCRGFGVAETVAIATAAVRDASNGGAFVERVYRETGIRFQIVSGLEEARLIHLGVSSALPPTEGPRLFVDIGGGSTELVVGRGGKFLHLDSLKLGAVRVAGRFPGAAASAPVPEALYAEMCAYVRNHSLRSVQKIVSWDVRAMVGSSGTIENLAAIAARRNGKGRNGKSGDEDARRLTFPVLAETARALCGMTLAERARVPGINPQRADIIVSGAAILQTLMTELQMPEIVVSDRGLLDGMLEDYLARGTYGYLDEAVPVRERSVLQLARSCHFDEGHARWASRLAVELFDSARAIGLHGYGAEERALLRYAGLLHDIGLFLSFHNHHEHSRYIVRNAELLGFTRREVEVMAMATYFHRKWSARRNRDDAGFSVMEPEDRSLSVTLGLFLRMAEALERTQRHTVADAVLTRRGKKIVLHLTLSAPSPTELASVEECRDSFKKILGKPFEVDFTLP